MILEKLKNVDPDVADVIGRIPVDYRGYEIDYIDRVLDKKFDNLIHAFPSDNLDNDDPKVFHLKSTFNQCITHISALRKKSFGELICDVILNMENIYRELNVSDGFSISKKADYFEKLKKKDSSPIYNVNGVQIHVVRFNYYEGLNFMSLGEGTDIENWKKDAIKDKYDLELSLLMDMIRFYGDAVFYKG